MTPPKGKYVDVVVDEGGFRVVVVDNGELADEAVEETAAGALLPPQDLIAASSDESLTITVGSTASSVWAPRVDELRVALDGRSLTEALRELVARHRSEGWGRVELFELLRHGLGMDHRDASLVLYWEPDTTKAPDVYSDAQVDQQLSDEVRRRLADPNTNP